MFRKRIISLLFTFLFFTIGKAGAQKAKVTIITTGYSGEVNVFDPAVNYNPKKFLSIIHLDKNGTGTYIADVARPGYINLYFALPGNIYQRYTLYLSPGDDLLFKGNFTHTVPVISTSGKGSNNNSPEIFALTNIDLYRFKEDKTPGRVIAAIKSQEILNNAILNQYIKQHQPSAGFIKNERLNCRYFALSNYYDCYHNKFPSAATDHKKWQRIEDSLMMRHPINNDGALTAFNYEHLIEFFLIQQPPILMKQAMGEDAAGFYRDWYHTTVNKAKKIYAGESRNLFIERMINKYFSGKTAELAYAQMLRFHLRFNHYEDLDLVFANFKHKYPASRYLPAFNAAITEAAAKHTQTLNNNMVFVAHDGTRLNTLEEVIRLMKGKTVFVDMWGTWCSPCRQELEKYTPQIKDHFKGKNITFLYIANKDTGRNKQWKKVIAYYKVNGTHILANQNLDKDIMTKIRATGYPTHFIIKKDGSFKKIKTQDESQTQQVIKEIEAEL